MKLITVDYTVTVFYVSEEIGFNRLEVFNNKKNGLFALKMKSQQKYALRHTLVVDTNSGLFFFVILISFLPSMCQIRQC